MIFSIKLPFTQYQLTAPISGTVVAGVVALAVVAVAVAGPVGSVVVVGL